MSGAFSWFSDFCRLSRLVFMFLRHEERTASSRSGQHLRRLYRLPFYSTMVLLSACSALPPFGIDRQLDETEVTSESQVDALVAEGQLLLAAELLWKQAEKKDSPERQEMQIRAVVYLKSDALDLKALAYLGAIEEEGMSMSRLYEKRLLEADIRDRLGQNVQVVELLPPSLFQEAPPAVQVEALQLRLKGQERIGDEVGVLRTRVDLDSLLDDSAKSSNQTVILGILGSLDAHQFPALMSTSLDGAAVQGWLELYALSREAFSGGVQDLIAEVSIWEDLHPGLELTKPAYLHLTKTWEYLNFRPERVALLLPLSGPFAKDGRVVEAGFFYARASQSTPDFEVRVYDSSRDEGVIKIYQEAVSQNQSDFVVGPLLKDSVAELASQGANVPTLALNYLSTGTVSSDNEIYQFGLLPEDEVKQMAAEILGKGNRYVAVIQQDDRYGRRLSDAFVKYFVSAGGIVRDRILLSDVAENYSSVVKELYRLNDSEERNRRVVGTIGEETRFTPRIRSDIDATVLLVTGLQLELLLPFVKYHYVDKLPVYTVVSNAYTFSRTLAKPDLNGLIYPEIPWLLAEGVGDFPAGIFSDKDARLFALGHDAYFLVSRVRQMGMDGSEADGLTGKISVLEGGRLYRRVSLAQFKGGYPRPLLQ